MLITLPPSAPKCFIASLVASRRPKTFVLNWRWNSSSYFLKRRELIDAGIVDEHVERAEGFFCLVEQPPHVGGLRYIGLNRDGLAALAGDVGDDAICALLAGGVIDDHRGARGGEPFGDSCAYAFRGAGHDCYLTRQLAHDDPPVCFQCLDS